MQGRGKGSGPAGLRGGLAARLAAQVPMRLIGWLIVILDIEHRADAAITNTTTIDINKLNNMHYRLSSGSRRESCAAGLH